MPKVVYNISFVHGLPDYLFDKLQKVQKSAARVLVDCVIVYKYDRIAPVLHRRHETNFTNLRMHLVHGYPTMLRSEQKWAHGTGAFWDLCIRSIGFFFENEWTIRCLCDMSHDFHVYSCNMSHDFHVYSEKMSSDNYLLNVPNVRSIFTAGAFCYSGPTIMGLVLQNLWITLNKSFKPTVLPLCICGVVC